MKMNDCIKFSDYHGILEQRAAGVPIDILLMEQRAREKGGERREIPGPLAMFLICFLQENPAYC